MREFIGNIITLIAALIALILGLIWLVSSSWDWEPMIVVSVAAMEIIGFTFFRKKDDSALLKKQNFEKSFFKLLETHNSAKAALEYRQDDKVIRGKEIFAAYVGEMTDSMNFPIPDGDKSLNAHQNFYDTIYWKYSDQVDIFMKTLDSVLEYIERDSLSDEDSKYYHSVVASQLNTDERIILQYHLKLYPIDATIKSRFRGLLYRSGTISLSDHHEFILDSEISRYGDDDDK